MGLTFLGFSYSSLDVPGVYSLILFLPKCNFRCRHCINWKVVLEKEEERIKEEEVLNEIKNNPVLECVVISGGEPTLHKVNDLVNFIEKVKEAKENVKVRIDTNGYNPDAVRELKKYVEGFAVDIKAPLEDKNSYSYVAKVKVDTERILESVELVDGMPLTIFRTVKYPWLSKEDLKKVENFTKKLKSKWFLNPFYEVPDCPFNG